MTQLDWREGWTRWAMQAGSGVAAICMVGGQFAQGAAVGQVIFTGGVAGFLIVAVWLVAAGDARRLRRAEADRAPEKEPLNMTVVGLLVIAIVMWLTAAYGIFIAALTAPPENKWHAIAYLGLAICATGAAFMVRRARQEWVERYLKDWPDRD